jgi:hypothetical protein
LAPYGVFRKRGRAADVTAPSRLPIGHLKQCQGVAHCGPVACAKCAVSVCCLIP